MPIPVESAKSGGIAAAGIKGRSASPRVVLITGASSGFGRTIASQLGGKGYRVYGTSRQAVWRPANEPHQPAATSRQMIRMDVCDTASVQAGVDFVLADAGRLDIVVCNAGFGLAGAVEDTAVAEVQHQFDTNFFGTWRVCRAVLPHLRQQHGGYLIIVSSLAGLMSVPFQAAYSASKFALEGLAEALRMEVKPWGVHVVLLEPGDFNTRFTRNRIQAAGSQKRTDYRNTFAQALAVMENDECHGPAPDKIVPLIEHIITHPHPRLRYTIGPVTQRLGALLKRVIPGRWFEWLMMKTYRLPGTNGRHR